MRKGWLAVGGFTVGMVAGVSAFAKMQSAGPKEVTVKMTSSSGQDAGRVTFKAEKKGVKMIIELKNVPFGDHAVHIHANAVCDAPDFKGAGGHFNPDMKKHGYENPEGHHNGDLPKNVSVDEDHNGVATFLLTSVSLDPAAPNSLFLNGGTSVVVHEKVDDMKTDPTGNAGNRIACGVIKQ